MQRVNKLIFVSPCVIRSHKTVFHCIHEKVTIEAPGALMRGLMEICDGTLSISQIVKKFKEKWDTDCLRALIHNLQRFNLLIDRNSIGEVMWRVVQNPSRFPSTLTDTDIGKLVQKAAKRQKAELYGNAHAILPSPFSVILRNRRSIRTFSGGKIDHQSMLRMLWSGYGEVRLEEGEDSYRKTVPSAGALFPLDISLVLLKKTGDLNPGIFRVWFNTPNNVGLSLINTDVQQIIRAFIDPLMLEKASGVVVVSGCFRSSSIKYGNRAVLYTILEAGHVAQNIHLSASESGIATVEIGGFVDGLLAKAIGLKKHHQPITTVVFGLEDKESSSNGQNPFIESYWALPSAGKFELPFSMAFARVTGTGNDDWSSGRDVDPRLAQIKAYAEAREWAACSCVPKKLVQSPFKDLDNAVDPRTVIKFDEAQYRSKSFPFSPFNDKVSYQWTSGSDEQTRSVVSVLADHVYFPHHPKTPRYVSANSSGVAAHPDREHAVRSGTLELIERDAFMLAYMAKLSFPTISYVSLPAGIQRRVNNLKKNSIRIWVKDFSLDLAPVIFIFAQSEKLAYTICAGCSMFSVETAIDHALSEIESSVLYRLANGPMQPIGLSKIQSPNDHGSLYEQRRFFRKADFLAHGSSRISFQEVGQTTMVSWNDLMDRFLQKKLRLITVPLQLDKKFGGNDGLHIVRSIVPGLIPISFGYREEPMGMQRLRDVAEEIKGVSISYRDIPKFPHPYT